MTTHEARRRVIDHLEDAGMVVYEQRVRHGLPAMGQLVMVDPQSGASWLVRVMVGKRPPRSTRLLHDRKREGISDVVAIVDPHDLSVVMRSNGCSGRIETRKSPRDARTSGGMVRPSEEAEHASPYPVPAALR